MSTFEEDCSIEFDAVEMVGDPAVTIKLNKRRVDELLEIYEDTDPQFPILRVRAGSVSKNGNHWPESILQDVAEQINNNEPVGYLGHISPSDMGFAFPEPQTLWLGAKVIESEGKPTLFVKGYNIPGQTARRHVKSGLIKTASWRGRALGKIVNKTKMIESFILESIDWARPGTAGMDARVVAVTSEMEGSEKEMDWATVTLDDIEKNNPSLFLLLEQRVAEKNKTAVQEMEDKVKKADEAVTIMDQLCSVLKIEKVGDALDRVGELMEKVDELGKTEVKQALTALLQRKFKNANTQKAISRFIPITEMVDKDEAEMEKFIDNLVDTDDDVKSIVTEMEESGARPPLRNQGGEDRTGSKVGRSGMVVEKTRKL